MQREDNSKIGGSSTSGFNNVSLDPNRKYIEVGNINDCSNKGRAVSDEKFLEIIKKIAEKHNEEVVFHDCGTVIISGNGELTETLHEHGFTYMPRSAEQVDKFIEMVSKIRANHAVSSDNTTLDGDF